jgi:predicted rRNA methylase YqxC with S4 and FtsJ domains
MILGLDISTSITGWTVLDGDKIIACEKLDLRNKKYTDFFDKSVAAKELLQNISKKYNITEIFIEETLNVMTRGMSSAHTIMTLNRFNGILSWMCYEVFQIKPQYIACRQARKMVGILVPKGADAKQIVLKHWLDTEPQFTVEYSKFGNPVQGTFDRADSLVIAKAGKLLCQKTSSTS